MVCPVCGSSHVKVTDTRERENGRQQRRRRVCMSCNNSWITVEIEKERLERLERTEAFCELIQYIQYYQFLKEEKSK